MKNLRSLFLLCAVVAASTLPAVAQQRVHSKDLEGTSWELVFDLRKEADSAIERIALKAVDGFMDEIEIRFDLRKDGALRVRATAFGEDDDDEYSTWSVNDDGQLTLGESDSFDSENSLFMRKGNRLVPVEKKRGKLVQKDSFYLRRVER